MLRPIGRRLSRCIAACAVGAVTLGCWPSLAGAESVADELIAILEANGQVSETQAARLREKAAVEREQLTREIMDHVQVQAEEVYRAHDEFENVSNEEEPVVHTSLAESMTIGGYIQALGSLSENSSASAMNGDRSSGLGSFDTTDFRETDGFSIRRARVKISGHAGPRTKFVVGFDGDNIDDPGHADALNFNDVYMEYQPALFDGTPVEGTIVRAGQFYVPFSREAQFSSSKRLPISRSHFVNELVPFREPGVMVYSKDLFDGRLALFGGISNGIGENEDDNDPFLLSARAEVLALDGAETGLGTADWSIGLAVASSSDGNGAGGSDSFDIADPIFLAGQDGELQYRGNRLLFTADTQLDVGRFGLNIEYLHADYDVRDSLMPTPGAGTALVLANGAGAATSDDVDLVRDDEFWGIHAMPSFWILEDVLQAYFKYEYVEYGDVLDASMWGTTVGLNYHLLPKNRSVIRANWVHLEHESDVLGPNAAFLPMVDDSLEQDFFLLEWQTKF